MLDVSDVASMADLGCDNADCALTNIVYSEVRDMQQQAGTTAVTLPVCVCACLSEACNKPHFEHLSPSALQTAASPFSAIASCRAEQKVDTLILLQMALVSL